MPTLTGVGRQIVVYKSKLIVKPNGCIEWGGSYKAKGGYGHTSKIMGEYLTHRIGWVLVNGPIPPGLKILHECDNPPCCNPDHLRLGTQKQNVEDCIAKGRFTIGEINGMSTLTADKVLTIRRLFKELRGDASKWEKGSRSRKQISIRLAAQFGISWQHVVALVATDSPWSQWKHLSKG